MMELGTVLPRLLLLASLVLHGAVGANEEKFGLDELAAATWHLPALRSLKFTHSSGGLVLPVIAAPFLQSFEGPIHHDGSLFVGCPMLASLVTDGWALAEADEKKWIAALTTGGKRLEDIKIKFSISMGVITALATAAGPALRRMDGHLPRCNGTAMMGAALTVFAHHCPNLEYLYLHNFAEDDEDDDGVFAPGNYHLEASVIFPALHTLRIWQATDSLLAVIGAPLVQHLQVGNYRGAVDVIFNKFPALETLHFDAHRLLPFHRDEGHPSLRCVSVPPAVPTAACGLRVQKLSVSADNASLLVIARCPNVTTLRILRGAESHWFFHSVSALPQLPNVTILACEPCDLSRAGLTGVASQSVREADSCAFVDSVVALLGRFPALSVAHLPLPAAGNILERDAAAQITKLFARAVDPFRKRGVCITDSVPDRLRLFRPLD